MLRPVAIAAALYFALPTNASAADTFASAVRDAVKGRKLQDSDLKAAGSSLTPYRDLATDGGILVGLEVALGGSPPVEHVVAVRPIYRTANQVRTGPPAGRFLSDEVMRTTRLIAREDYAVASITSSGDRQVDGLSLRFARVAVDALNTADAYDSEWLGSTKATRRETLDGHGRPVVGLFGRIEDGSVFALGMTFVELSRLPAPPASVTAATPEQQALVETSTEVAAEARKINYLPLIVFGAVAVPIGLIGVFAWRRTPTGVRQLPQPPARSEFTVPRPKAMPRPPSIPDGSFDLDELMETKIPSLREFVQSETECVVH
jgi:hypothetical protein